MLYSRFLTSAFPKWTPLRSFQSGPVKPKGNKADIIRNANKVFSQQKGGPDKWSTTQKLAAACRVLADEGHGSGLSGQVTARGPEPGTMWTQPYGYGLEELKASDYILVNEDLEVLEGEGFPNPANNFHLHVYRSDPNLQSIMHTHPPHASALAMIGKPLEVSHMDVMCFYNDVEFLPHWPGVPFGDEEGEIITTALKGKRAILLAHHGMLVASKSIEQSTYLAMFFERAARIQLLAMAAGEIQQVDPKLGQEAHDWRLSDGPVGAHYRYWTRAAVTKYPDCLH